jgi:hypothetical protein
MPAMVAVLAEIVNWLLLTANSPPVATVTARGPTRARQSTETFTVACKPSVTVTESISTPSPKFANVTPFRKWVLIPVTTTGTLLEHAGSAAGEIDEKDNAGLALTRNPPVSDGSPAGHDGGEGGVPEGIAQAVYEPGVALAGIVILAVMI